MTNYLVSRIRGKNCIKIKANLACGRLVRNGHTSVDRNIHISPEAKQAIEDAVAEYYEKQNLDRVKQGLPMLPQRVENDWQRLPDLDFFKHIPSLLRVNHDLTKDPITDCLAQIRQELLFTHTEDSSMERHVSIWI